jgi:hypothetical protein
VNTVAPGTGAASGTVAFTQKVASKKTTLCTSDLSGTTPDVATCTVSYGKAGNHVVTATCNGSAGYPCSNGNTQTLAGGTASCTIAAARVHASGSPLAVLAGYEGNRAYQPSSAGTTEVINPAAAWR